jgi:lysophospholipase L1-like esterase
MHRLWRGQLAPRLAATVLVIASASTAMLVAVPAAVAAPTATTAPKATVAPKATTPTTTVAPSRTPAVALPRVFLLGDSVMAGLPFGTGLKALQGSYSITIDAQVCRRLVSQSCAYQGKTPASALSVAQANRTKLAGQVVVVMAGYNDSSVAAPLATFMQLFEAAGVRQVVWATYRNLKGAYTASNATLLAARATYPKLTVGDWDAFSKGQTTWFGGDGLHLTGAGSAALAAFLHDQIELALAASDPGAGTTTTAPAATTALASSGLTRSGAGLPATAPGAAGPDARPADLPPGATAGPADPSGSSGPGLSLASMGGAALAMAVLIGGGAWIVARRRTNPFDFDTDS